MTVTPIETKYAGCNFRSRLEARWAVCLDHLGIRWEYEPQGFELTWRLDPGEEASLQYLPDFWLPDEGLWAEVKGSLTEGELAKLLNAAASLSSNDGGGCHDKGGNDVVLLGPVPDPTRRPLYGPVRLHMHKGDLLASSLNPEPCGGTTVARDSNEIFVSPEDLLHGWRYGSPQRSLREALAAARSARFEHGESGQSAQRTRIAPLNSVKQHNLPPKRLSG